MMVFRDHFLSKTLALENICMYCYFVRDSYEEVLNENQDYMSGVLNE